MAVSDARIIAQLALHDLHRSLGQDAARPGKAPARTAGVTDPRHRHQQGEYRSTRCTNTAAGVLPLQYLAYGANASQRAHTDRPRRERDSAKATRRLAAPFGYAPTQALCKL